MKKYALFILTVLALILKIDVYACGEITELNSNIGSVSVVNDSNYLVTIPVGTKEVTLTGKTDYSWVDGYEPRTVSTSSKIELKVDGNTCGYGIYTYFVSFKEFSPIIAEKDPEPSVPEEPQTPANTTPDSGGAPTGSGDLLLSKLEITLHELDFDPYKYEYDLEVDMDVTSLDIIAEAADSTISISISSNAYSLKEGKNVVAITLVDANGNTSVYNINVNRVKAKSNNNFLAALSIEGYQLNFDPSVTVYELGIRKEKTLNISAVPESELANFVILGNMNLSDGDTITIRVAAEDKTTRDYVINIKRVFNIMDYWIYIIILLLVLFIVIILIINKQKKNKKNMGPQTVEGNKNTAGVIQEIAPQNTVSEQSNIQQTSQTVTPVQPGVLKIIEPTNLDPVEEIPVTTVDEDNSPTEVFQL